MITKQCVTVNCVPHLERRLPWSFSWLYGRSNMLLMPLGCILRQCDWTSPSSLFQSFNLKSYLSPFLCQEDSQQQLSRVCVYTDEEHTLYLMKLGDGWKNAFYISSFPLPPKPKPALLVGTCKQSLATYSSLSEYACWELTKDSCMLWQSGDPTTPTHTREIYIYLSGCLLQRQIINRMRNTWA